RRRNIFLKTSRGDRASRQRTPQQFSRSRPMSSNLPSINRIAQIMGGDVAGAEALVPGPGHSAEDRSLSIKLDDTAPDGFVVHSFAGDDPIACRDHVRKKLGLPKF